MTQTSLPPDLRTRLAEFGRRLHRQQMVQGICRLVLLMILAAGAAVGLDALLTLPGWVRGLLFIGWLYLGFVEVRRYIRRRIIQPLYAEGLAAAVEEEYPRLGERLTTAVELAGGCDPANGSPYLVSMLVRDAETRTSKLDLKRAAPSAGTLLFIVASVAAAALAIGPLLAIPSAAQQARRFFTPWHVTPIEVPYKIIVTSGDPTIKRGENTTLSALVAPTKPDAVQPEAATVIIKSRRAIEQAAMVFDADKREAYLTRGPLEDDLEYQVVSGDARSEWHRVTVVDPVRIESARISIVPPPYARPAAEPQVPLEGLSDMTALQWSRITFALRFNRVPASAWLEWKPDVDDPDRASPVRINVPVADDGAASIAVTARTSGEYRLHADAGNVKTDFRPQPLRVTLDMPPKFEKVSGITARPLSIRPGERLPLECKVVDDFGVAKVNLELRVNDKPAQVIALPLRGIGTLEASGNYALDLSPLAREGDRLVYRLAASDNRLDAELGLTPQTTYFPEGGKWIELRLSADAPPLKEQEILAQQKEIDERLRQIREALKREKESAAQLKERNVRLDLLPQNQSEQLDRLQGQVEETAEALDELGKNQALSPALAGLAGAVRGIAELEVRGADASLRQAQRDEKAEPRNKNLDNAVSSLAEAIRKADLLLAENDRLARDRLDQFALENLAQRQQRLADEAARSAPGKAASLRVQEKELEEALARLDRESESIRQARDALRQETLGNSAQQASQLEKDLRDLTRAMRETDQQALDGKLGGLSGLLARQQDLAQRARELARRTSTAARTAPLSPLKADGIDNAIASLNKGNLQEAIDQQERAARELDRLARELENAAERARDPREAARQLERLQAELQTRIMDSAKAAQTGRLSKQAIAALKTQQQAIQKAIEKLSVPPGAAEAEKSRAAAAAGAGVAAEAIEQGDPAKAADRMKEAQTAIGKLADQLPTKAVRMAQSRGEFLKLQREQDEIAGLAAKAVKQFEKNDPDAAATSAELSRLVADLARRQAVAAERLGKLDVPGEGPRRDKAVAALCQAQNDLEAGRPQDIAASQQTARRQLERLEQAMQGQDTPDDQADRLAKKQKDLLVQMKHNAQRPDERQTGELRKKETELANDLAKLQAGEAQASKDEAMSLARKAGEAGSAQELVDRATKAAESLQGLADRLNGRESEADKADRLAKKQKKVADEVDRLAKKKETPPDMRQTTQRMLDELKTLRPGADSQSDKQQALEALTQAQRAGSSEQAVKASRDAAEVLTRMASRMKAAQGAASPTPVPANAADEHLQGLPNLVDADEARNLAAQQRQLRDELARAAARDSQEPPSAADALDDLIAEQEKIVLESAAFAKTQKLQPSLGEQAAESARQAAVQLRNGRIDPARAAGRLASNDFHQIVEANDDQAIHETGLDLACRQDLILHALDNSNPQSGAAQQAQRQRQLQQQTQQLRQKLERQASQAGQDPSSTGRAARDAAGQAGQAESAMKNAVDRNAQGDRQASRDMQDKAADALARAAGKLGEAGRQPANPQQGANAPADRQSARSIEDAREGMDRAAGELAQGQPGKAAPTMARVAQSLREAAGQLGGLAGMGRPSGSTPNTSGATLGQTNPTNLDLQSKLPANLKGKSWGEIPGQIKDQIISDMKARYGEEYAKFIKLYFEQLAERK